jgi:hypothetical protein
VAIGDLWAGATARGDVADPGNIPPREEAPARSGPTPGTAIRAGLKISGTAPDIPRVTFFTGSKMFDWKKSPISSKNPMSDHPSLTSNVQNLLMCVSRLGPLVHFVEGRRMVALSFCPVDSSCNGSKLLVSVIPISRELLAEIFHVVSDRQDLLFELISTELEAQPVGIPDASDRKHDSDTRSGKRGNDKHLGFVLHIKSPYINY